MIGKGCFSKIIILLIILAGTGYYLINKYGSDLWNNLKSNVVTYIHNDVEERIENYISESANAELEDLLNRYSEKIKTMDFSDAYKDAADFFDDLKTFMSDSNINEHEIFELKKYLDK